MYTKQQGAFTKSEKTIVQTVVPRRDFVRLKNFIAVEDPTAFMVVTNAHSVSVGIGKNFLNKSMRLEKKESFV